MSVKPNILFIGNYNREDYVRLLEASKVDCNLYFLFFASPNEELSKFYQEYGQAIYWKDFDSAQQLLKIIAPDKVVFLYIESYNHVVLNLACKEAGIPTYLLEHGLRADYVLGFDPKTSPGRGNTLKNKFAYYYQTIRDFGAHIRSRKFLTNSINQLTPINQAFARKFVEIRSKHNYLEAFRKIKSEKRLADYYIGFSPKIFEAFKAHEAPYFGGPAKFIGIPYFDKLAFLPKAPLTRSILLIDQPLAEQGLLKWDMKYKATFVQQLSAICQLHQYHLYVKPHPKQDLSLWQKLEKKQQCTIVDDKRLAELASCTALVLGFYSTYLMPFAAYAHTTVITYENHPAGSFVVSKPLIEAGVVHSIYTLDDLHSILLNPDIIHQQQIPNKAKFTEEWLYKFDGKSGERLRDILLSSEP